MIRKLTTILDAALIGLTSSLATQHFMNGNTTTAVLWTIAACCWFISTIFNVLAFKDD